MSDLGDDRVSVSVIIASYNLAEYLPAALDSAIGQTCRPTEIGAVREGRGQVPLQRGPHGHRGPGPVVPGAVPGTR